MNDDQSQSTVYALVSAAVFSNIPSWVLSTGEKLLYGAVLALVSGFAYRAGTWAWDRMIRRRSQS